MPKIALIAIILSIIALSSMIIPLNFSAPYNPMQSESVSPFSSNVQVTFSETGLSGQVWSVTLSGFTVNTTREEISFFIQSGNYTFSIGSPPGFIPSIRNGSIHVTNEPITISIKFTRTETLTFYEKGLPSGQIWSVVINGSRYSSSNTTITVVLPYGLYNYSIVAPTFYAAESQHGRIGPGNETLLITIIHEPTEYIIIILILVIVDAAIVAVLVRRRARVAGK